MIEIAIVLPDNALQIWPDIEGYLSKAMKGTVDKLFQPVDLLAGIFRNEWTLWTAKEGDRILAAMLTRLCQYPRGRTCHMFLIGGIEMRKWADQYEKTIEAYARENGCCRMESGGRSGWVRVGHGYEFSGRLIVKDL